MNITKTPITTFLILLFILMIPSLTYTQVNPTLGVGLGELTMKKGTIDVEVLTEIIMEKQKELKKEALKRFLYDKFPAGNFATKFYIQNCLNTLLNEKNPQVIKKEILELTTNYSIALGLAVVYDYNSPNYDLQDSEIRTLLTQINADIKEGYKINKDFDLSDTISKTLDYKLIVDIVSLSLSNSQKIKEKGFYKNPINYMEGKQYTYLTRNSKNMRTNLQNLATKITNQIDKYVKNYDVIQEFYSRYKGAKPLDIKNTLLQDYNKEILALFPSSSFPELLVKISPDKNFKSAFANYANHIEEFNYKKTQNENYANLKNNLSQLAKVLKDLRLNKEKLEKSTNLIKDKGFDLKVDSLIDSKEIQKRIQNSKLSVEQNDTLKSLLDKYNDIKAGNLELNKKLLDLKTNILAITKLVMSSQSSLNPTKLENEVYIDGIIKNINQYVLSYTPDQILDSENTIKADLLVIFQKEDFLQLYLKFLIDNLLNKKEFTLGLDLKSDEELKITKEYSQAISTFYANLETIANKNTITIADVNYIEKQIIPQFLKYSFFAKTSDFTKIITNLRILNNLLKIKIINDANDDGEFIYNSKLNNIFTFISNLDKLNKAETYQSVVNLIQQNNENVTKCLPPNFQPIYILFINGIKKYTLLNTSEQYIEVDVVSFLNDLQQYYNRKNRSWFSLYFTLGISENFFPKSVMLPGATEKIDNIGFASEKIGVQFTINTFRKEKGFTNLVDDKVYTNIKNPFLNKFYGIIYGSGLLYSLANTTTNENFDYPHIGVGLGLRFYNALDFNISYCLPFIEGGNFGENGFFSIGLDIPLGEYLERLGKK
ncbi:hypothetical protein ACEN2I_04395 [Flavobacterium sp. W22_SRS_FK3]|uniref:hypothetical protein n=1 Tax=Flavobacterium sp. W22_SRS_FK3 TaxID=3240275 RepID=UPI003F9118E6